MNSPESAWVQDHATNDTLRCTTLSNEYYGALPQMWIVDTIRTVWRRGQSVLCSLGKCVAPTLRLRGRLRGKRQFGRTDGPVDPLHVLRSPLSLSATKNTRLGQSGRLECLPRHRRLGREGGDLPTAMCGAPARSIEQTSRTDEGAAAKR